MSGEEIAKFEFDDNYDLVEFSYDGTRLYTLDTTNKILRIYSIETEELLDKIEDITTLHYIGHLFNDNFLDIYIYLEKPKEVHNWLQTQVNKEGLFRGFAYEIAEDPKWDTIKPFMN